MRIALFLVFGITAPAPAPAQGPPAPAPLGAWTPIPELPVMGRPVDTAAVAARRRALAARIGRGVVLVPSARERQLERDYVQDNDFRQNNTFFYLTELETQDAWLLIVAPGGDDRETVLFLPPRNPAQERWTGLRLGPDSVAARASGIPRVLATDSLDRVLRSARARAAGPLYLPLDVSTRDEPRITDLTFDGGDVRSLRPIVDSLRLVKDADEVSGCARRSTSPRSATSPRCGRRGPGCGSTRSRRRWRPCSAGMGPTGSATRPSWGAGPTARRSITT